MTCKLSSLETLVSFANIVVERGLLLAEFSGWAFPLSGVTCVTFESSISLSLETTVESNLTCEFPWVVDAECWERSPLTAGVVTEEESGGLSHMLLPRVIMTYSPTPVLWMGVASVRMGVASVWMGVV